MTKKLPFFSVFLAFFYFGVVNAQNGCDNADFESGTFQNWTGQTGSCCAINTPTNGIVNGQHTIMTGPGLDPNSCGQIPVVAPGSTFSARLGNDLSGYGAERLRYNFTITPANTLIIYKYAVVLEDGGHSAADQPRFVAKLTDQNGQTIPCTNYYVAAGAGSGFQNCGGVQYKPWITIGVDVSAYVGQTVTLDFATGDCGQGAHFGYAYVDAGCAPFIIDSRYCEVQNGLNVAVLTAPPGFQSYLWSNGGTNNTTVVVNPQQGEVITCQITSVNGCVANLQATMTPSDVTTSYIPESACVGDTINLVNTTLYENAIEDSVSWTSSDGFSSNTTDFSHIFNTPGNYQVELYVQSDAGCRDSVTQTITVFESPVSSIQLSDICLGDQAQIASTSTISDNSPLTHTWSIEGNAFTGSPITYNFTGVDTVTITLVSQSQNNCIDSAQQQIIIYDNPIADFTFVEQCTNVPVDFTNTSTMLSPQNLYSWIFNTNEVATTVDYSNQFSSTGPNSITLIVQDVYPTVTCDDTITQPFFVHDLPTILYVGDTTQCEDLSFVIDNQTTVSTNETLAFDWTLAGATIATSEDLSYTINDAGVYPITLTATSSFGCEMDSTFDMYIYPTPPEPILSVSTPVCPGDPVSFEAVGIPNSTIQWTGPNNFNSTDFVFATAIEIAGMGFYTASITSEYGCVSDTSNIYASILYINGFDDFEFPNVITADGDGVNDELDLQTYFKTCEKYTLYILNRWGNVVFTQTIDSTPFSGYTQEGNELEEGVYFYKLVVHDAAEDKSVKSGFIHVVK